MKRVIRHEPIQASRSNLEDGLIRVVNSIDDARGFLSGAFNQIQDDSLRDMLTKLNDISEHLTRAYDISITTLRGL